jgi:hypothetical protein
MTRFNWEEKYQFVIDPIPERHTPSWRFRQSVIARKYASGGMFPSFCLAASALFYDNACDLSHLHSQSINGGY